MVIDFVEASGETLLGRILEKTNFYVKGTCFLLPPLMTFLEANLGKESQRFQKCFGTLA